MYSQGYLDPARTRNQFAYYPSPNFPAYAGYVDDIKALPAAWFDGVKAMQMDQIIGAVGLVMVGSSYLVKGKKKIAKKIPVTQKQALQVGGALMTAYSLYQTYASLPTSA
jgi:hypothetical protein